MLDVLVCSGLVTCTVLLVVNSRQLWVGRRKLKVRLQMLDKLHSEELRQQRRLVELSRLHAARQFEVRWLRCSGRNENPFPELFSILDEQAIQAPRFLAWLVNEQGEVLFANSGAKKLQTSLVFSSSGLRELQNDFPVKLHSHREDFQIIPGSIAEEIEELHVLPCSFSLPSRTFFCLSEIPPLTGDEETDYKLLCRLVRQLRLSLPQENGGSFKDSTSELNLIRDMLALRTLADGEFESPKELMQTFLSRLAALTDFERATLFQQSSEENGTWEFVASGGIPMPSEQIEKCLKLEHTVRHSISTEQNQSRWLDDAELPASSSELKFNSCLLALGDASDGAVTSILLSSRFDVVQHSIKLELAKWSAQFLPQTFKKAISRLQVEERARRDGLTRVANRQTFDTELQKAIRQTQANHEACSLLLIDIDHFKSINDTYGHPIGDLALQAIAAILTQCTQQSRVTDYGLVARYGGEEFAILFPKFPLSGAKRVAEQIRQTIQDREFRFENHLLSMTVSIGVASCHGEEGNAADLVRCADEALYLAKRTGRNCVKSSGESLPVTLQNGVQVQTSPIQA